MDSLSKGNMSSKQHVVILGYVAYLSVLSTGLTESSAGVIGLTNAVFLSEAGYTVTVIAAHVPGDSSIEYTSPWYVHAIHRSQADNF